MLEVEDVACPVDDMTKAESFCSEALRGIRGWTKGRENDVQGPNL